MIKLPPYEEFTSVQCYTQNAHSPATFRCVECDVEFTPDTEPATYETWVVMATKARLRGAVLAARQIHILGGGEKRKYGFHCATCAADGMDTAYTIV